MLKAKSGWSSVIDHNDMGKDSHHFSPYFDASQEINQSPNLTALLGSSNINKINSLSASSNKSAASNHSSYFQKPIEDNNKLISGRFFQRILPKFNIF